LIPSLTLPFSKGGNTVAAGSTRFPPFEKGRVREGIPYRKVKKIKLQGLFLSDSLSKKVYTFFWEAL
jgi:hypothetical protein